MMSCKLLVFKHLPDEGMGTIQALRSDQGLVLQMHLGTDRFGTNQLQD